MGPLSSLWHCLQSHTRTLIFATLYYLSFTLSLILHSRSRTMSEDDERRMSATQSETEIKELELDFNDRDPKKIAEIYKVDFADVIAEPDNLRSLNIVWKCSYHTFRMTVYVFYCSLTTILGLPLSLVWGLLFALQSFLRIWAIVPCIKSCQITALCLFQPVLMLLRVLVTPILEAAAKAFRHMKGFKAMS